MRPPPKRGGRNNQTLGGKIMKSQMRFQKILTIVTIVIAALSIVYALIFCSGVIGQIDRLVYLEVELDGAILLNYRSQSFSDLFLILGIVLVLTVALMFIMGNHSRRKYYVTNYVAVGVYVAFALVFVVLLLVKLIGVQSALNAIDMEVAKEVYTDPLDANSPFGEWTDSAWTIYLGFAYMGLLIVNVVAVVLNLVWKIKLVQGERALLEGKNLKEAA